MTMQERLRRETEREVSPWELTQPEKVDYRTFVWSDISRRRSYSNTERLRYSSRTGRWS